MCLHSDIPGFLCLRLIVYVDSIDRCLRVHVEFAQHWLILQWGCMTEVSDGFRLQETDVVLMLGYYTCDRYFRTCEIKVCHLKVVWGTHILFTVCSTGRTLVHEIEEHCTQPIVIFITKVMVFVVYVCVPFPVCGCVTTGSVPLRTSTHSLE